MSCTPPPLIKSVPMNPELTLPPASSSCLRSSSFLLAPSSTQTRRLFPRKKIAMWRCGGGPCVSTRGAGRPVGALRRASSGVKEGIGERRMQGDRRCIRWGNLGDKGRGAERLGGRFYPTTRTKQQPNQRPSPDPNAGLIDA